MQKRRRRKVTASIQNTRLASARMQCLLTKPSSVPRECTATASVVDSAQRLGRNEISRKKKGNRSGINPSSKARQRRKKNPASLLTHSCGSFGDNEPRMEPQYHSRQIRLRVSAWRGHRTRHLHIHCLLDLLS